MIDRVLLFPYYLVLGVRAVRYRRNKRKTEIPTVCVGNVTVGGTGKTPHTELILDILQNSDEYGSKNIAMLSRGYGRRTSGFLQVRRDGDSREFGDEPLQICRKFPAVTVAVDRNRIEGCDYLRHPDKIRGRRTLRSGDAPFPPADLAVLDDAFQYIRLKADVSVVLVDYNRPVDTDRLLPFGNLRDIPQRLRDADIVVVTKCPYNLDEDDERDSWAERLKISDSSRLFFTTIQYEPLLPLFSAAEPRYVFSGKAILFTGIANGQHLHNHLSDNYKVLDKISFPDHHRYTAADFRRIEMMARKDFTSIIVTTEKDAQRVLDVNGIGEEVQRRLFYCPIKAGFFSETEKERFSALLLSMLKKGRS